MHEPSQKPAGAGPAWTDDDLAGDPHAAADKARRVEQMFAAIAPSYDLNNRLHSLWRDQAWRRSAVRLAEPGPDDVVLDVACGTGDLATAFAEAGVRQVLGADFTFRMLQIARAKQARQRGARTTRSESSPAPVTYCAADAMQLPLADQSVDIVSIAFGLRNVAEPGRAMQEFHRVLRPGGRVIVLEFSLPRHPLLHAAYQFYFRHVMPRTAALIARDRSGAYRYLPRSVNTFLDRPALLAMMQKCGFVDARAKALTFGIAVCYRADKPA